MFDVSGDDSPQVLKQRWDRKSRTLFCAVYAGSTGRLIWAKLKLSSEYEIHFDYTYTQITTIWRPNRRPSDGAKPTLDGFWKCGESSLNYQIKKQNKGYRLAAAIDAIDGKKATITLSRWMQKTSTLRFAALMKSNQRTFCGEIQADWYNGARLIYTSNVIEPMFRIDPASLAKVKRSKGRHSFAPVAAD